MATTTNYSWSTPDDTALVKDGAAAIRSLGTAIDTTVFNNAGAAIAKTIVDAKGDIIAATAADTVSRLAVGANDTVLTADSTAGTGLKWATPPAGGGMTLLSTTSLSGATTTVSVGSGYKDLVVIANDVANNTANGEFRMAINGDTTNVFTIGIFTNGSGFGNFGNANTRWQSGASTLRTDADNAFYWTIKDYESSTNYKNIIGSNVYMNQYSEQRNEIFGGGYKSNTAISSLVFSNAGGNLSGGTVRVFGVN